MNLGIKHNVAEQVFFNILYFLRIWKTMMYIFYVPNDNKSKINKLTVLLKWKNIDIIDVTTGEWLDA